MSILLPDLKSNAELKIEISMSISTDLFYLSFHNFSDSVLT